MSSHEKLLQRFLKLPKDFTWDELSKLLRKYGYVQCNKGKTSGSRVVFENKILTVSLDLHRPHPKNVLKPYQMKDVLEFLMRIGVVDIEEIND